MRVGIDCRMLGRTGIGRYISNLIENLELSNLVAFRGATTYASDWPSEALAARLIYSPVFSIREQWELPRAIGAEKLDVFHTPQINVPMFARVAQVATIFDCTLDRFPKGLPSHSARAYYRAMVWAAARKSQAVIVPSDATKRDLINFHRVPDEKVHIIPLGVDCRKFARKPAQEKAAAELKRRLNLGDQTLLYVGLAHPHKNLRRLMRALRTTVNAPSGRWKQLKLVCAGPLTPRFPSPVQLAQEESIAGSVIQAGQISDDDLTTLMQACTVLVLPSLAEGFGLPALEAMACGLPVLLSSISALRETAGSAAIYFDPLQEEDLAGKLQYLLDHDESRAQLIHAGYERIQEFTWEKCARKTAQVYEKIAANR